MLISSKTLFFALLSLASSLLLAGCSRHSAASASDAAQSTLLPTGKRITPLAAPGAHFEMLNPGLPDFPRYVAGQAMSTAVSPDEKTLLILTSGFNRINGEDGRPIPDASNEYVFVYDISTGGMPRKKQVVQVPDTFAGIAFAPAGKNFYVSGGTDDNLHTFALAADSQWKESGSPIKLGHSAGLGFFVGKEPLAAGGLAVTPDGKTVLVANIYNDSVSVIDVAARRVTQEVQLRPGKINAKDAGVAGGEYPFWVVAKDNQNAYVSCLRDREIVALSWGAKPVIEARIKVAGNPNKMILNRDGSRLFAAADNSDTVSVIDTATNRVLENISTTGPLDVTRSVAAYRGSAPNSLALAHDGRTLFVTNGGSNSVAVVRLAQGSGRSVVAGLLPTGWYPNAVSLSRDDRTLYVVNGKSTPGPNPELKNEIKTESRTKPGPDVILARNAYILQLEKAGFLTVPVPDAAAMVRLTAQVATNNAFSARETESDEKTMAALHGRIKHVIYIVKENRTYDQILGDLGKGNGDPKLTMFGEKITPNFHRLAREFVDLDNFYNSGEVSGDGWPWSTSGRESDFGIKAVILNYANRGTNYEYEGMNRDLNVGLATVKERQAANPKTPSDPDLLPGAVNVAEPDGPEGTPHGKGYLWDAVLRAGLTFREYGCMSDMNLDAPREPHPFQAKVIVSRPSNPELYRFGDPYFRGFDPGYPDFYREAEWEREFGQYVAHRNLPAFEIVQLQEDHMGEFKAAISGVNTPERQQADNDYAVGRLMEAVAHSPYRDDTLIFSIEDDSQDGPDHVDAHRTTAYVVGPYVKHHAVISEYYTTVSLIRTIEDVLGVDHLNLNTATARPMSAIFDLNQKDWSFAAHPSGALLETTLPLDAAERQTASGTPPVSSTHGRDYWARATQGFDFKGEDRIDSDKFNHVLWEGIKGGLYPEQRSGRNLRSPN